MGIWVVSSLGCLQMKLPYKFMYKSLYRHKLLFLLDKYLIFRLGSSGECYNKLANFFFKSGCTILHSIFYTILYTTVWESSSCSVSLPDFSITNLFKFRHPNRYIVAPCCGSNSHFPND